MVHIPDEVKELFRILDYLQLKGNKDCTDNRCYYPENLLHWAVKHPKHHAEILEDDDGDEDWPGAGYNKTLCEVLERNYTEEFRVMPLWSRDQFEAHKRRLTNEVQAKLGPGWELTGAWEGRQGSSVVVCHNMRLETAQKEFKEKFGLGILEQKAKREAEEQQRKERLKEARVKKKAEKVEIARQREEQQKSSINTKKKSGAKTSKESPEKSQIAGDIMKNDTEGNDTYIEDALRDTSKTPKKRSSSIKPTAKSRISMICGRQSVLPGASLVASGEPPSTPTAKLLHRCVLMDPQNISIAILDQHREILHACSMQAKTFLQDVHDFVRLSEQLNRSKKGGREHVSSTDLADFSEGLHFRGKLYRCVTDDDERTHLISENSKFIFIEYLPRYMLIVFADNEERQEFAALTAYHLSKMLQTLH